MCLNPVATELSRGRILNTNQLLNINRPKTATSNFEISEL